VADTVVDLTGGYDMLDDITAKKDELAGKEAGLIEEAKTPDLKLGFAESGAGVLPGTRTSMPEMKTTPPTGRRGVSGFGAPLGGDGLSSNVSPGSITPDGALTLKVKGFYDILAQFLKDSKATA